MAEGYLMAFNSSPGTSCYDSDDDEVQGRILSTEELIERLRNRGDFLCFDTNRRLRFTEAVSIVCAVITGLWLSKQDLSLDVPIDFYEPPMVHNGSTTVIPNVIDRPTPPVHTVPKVINIDKKTRVSINSRPADNPGAKRHGGTGSIESRVAKAGIFGVLSKNSSKAWTGGDLLAQGGFADGIDRVLSGPKGLKKGSGGSVNRKGMAVIGDGPGFGSEGFDGGAGPGVDDLIDNLMAAQTGELSLKTPRSPPARVLADIHQGSAKFIGGRSRSSIMAVVLQNISSLRYEYNKHLREKPGIKGNVKIRFSIDEFGKVIFCDVIESSMHDPDFERTVSAIISRWRFEKIDKPGDITEIVYPFVFSS